MLVTSEADIADVALKPFLGLWREKAGGRGWPERTDIALPDLKRSARHVFFCKATATPCTADTLVFTNVGSAFYDALGSEITGISVAQAIAMFDHEADFIACFGEYVRCVNEGRCFYNRGHFPRPGMEWLVYTRVIMPVGPAGDQPNGLFGVVNFEDTSLALSA